MNEQKIYMMREDEDGSSFLTVNKEGEYSEEYNPLHDNMEEIRYYKPLGDLCYEDIALSILANYFEEDSADVKQRKGRSWQLHRDFERDVIAKWIGYGGDELYDYHIEAWIVRYKAKKNLEQELIKMLGCLSIIVEADGDGRYIWKWASHAGTADTFTEALQYALAHVTGSHNYIQETIESAMKNMKFNTYGVNTNKEIASLEEEETEYQELMNEANSDLFLRRGYEKFDNDESWQSDEKERHLEEEETTDYILDDYPW